jgi:hypothetical protein
MVELVRRARGMATGWMRLIGLVVWVASGVRCADTTNEVIVESSKEEVSSRLNSRIPNTSVSPSFVCFW